MRIMSQESKRVHRNCNITPPPPLESEVPTEDLKVSIWLPSNIGEGNIIVVKDRISTDFLNNVFEELLFLSLFAILLGARGRNRSDEASLFRFLDHIRSGGVRLVGRCQGG